jgi:putative oxidoreductase
MASFKDILLMRFVRERTQAGLALLRVWTGATLFLRHGLEKQPAHWAQFMAHFPDPIGIGSHPSFVIAFLSDFVCSLLLIIGLGTRWAALFCLSNIFVAWAFVHHFAFFGKGPGSDHGELMALYMGALFTILVAGPGAACVDRILARKS